ncbi:MAG TPA: MATE family efflux transporter [Candidatus Butyricicoccus avicola]|nr:MATE family efflux transporter [Candidatus Butyricicoccus avicola]
MNRMLREKSFYKTFAILTLSLALQNLLTYSVNMADNIMLGRFSQDALSGASLCNQLQFFLQMLVQGVGEGVVVLGARYWGKKDLKHIPHIIGAGLRFGVAIAVLMFLAALFFPEQIIRLMSNDEAIVEQGVQYLQIICFTYVLFALTNMLTASLRTIGIVKIGYMISASTLCINICLNYVLIYGHFGAPALGVRGAAIATLVSRAVELLIVIWYLKFREHTLNLNWRKLLFIDTSYIKDYIHVSLPVLITQALWGFSSIVQTAVLGNMDNSAMVVPANSISVLVFQILSVVGYGAASAAAILTGRTLGEGKKERIDQTAFTFQVLFCIIGVFTGLIIFFSRGPVMMIYDTLTPEAAELTQQFITVLAITSVGTCYQMAADSGILRAGGDTRFAMWNNMVFTWLICLPCAILSAFVFHFPPVVVFFCLKMDQLGKCPVIFLRVRSKKWIKQITRQS